MSVNRTPVKVPVMKETVQSKVQAAAPKGLSLSKEDAREIIYGMPYETWRATFQKDPKKPAKHSS